MASEDSDEVVSGFLAIHGLHDLDDIGETVRSQVVTRSHELNASRELLEVVPLGRPERMLPEEGNDPLE